MGIRKMLLRSRCRARLILISSLFITLVYLSTSTLRGLKADEILLQRHFLDAQVSHPENPDHIDNLDDVYALARIPRIIHQIYKNDTIPEKWSQARTSCLEHHPAANWTHILWTDEKARLFITSFYSWFLPVYDSYPYNVQRFDALRYLLLYHFGGIYLDLDVGCKRNLTPLLRHGAFFGKTSPYGVSNDVMGSENRSPLFRLLVSSLKGRNHHRGTKYPTVMMSTGPLFVTHVLLEFLRAEHSNPYTGAFTGKDSSVAVLPPDLYGMSPVSYFEHYPGSSWHGWDVWVLGQMASWPFLCFGIFLLLLWAWCATTKAKYWTASGVKGQGCMLCCA